MMDKLKTLIKSRRFWTAIGSVLIVILQDAIGLPEGTATSVVAIGISWIVGDSLRATD